MSAVTVDDLLRRVFTKLLNTKNHIKASRGETKELTGVLLKITNPRARLSRTEVKGKVFSCLGELLWYLSKKNDLEFIKYYVPHYDKESEDGKTVYGGYGPRLFDMKGSDQIANIISLLKKKPESRRAVVQLFDADDIRVEHKEIPCTCTLQFMVRRKRLHMFVGMRSNDAFLGLPHDVFAFTMLQEIMARSLSAELGTSIDVGTYKHAVGSLHLYERHISKAQQYIDEGWQSTSPMPHMPAGDPWPSISSLLQAESLIRVGEKVDVDKLDLEPYWEDFVRLLQVFRHAKYKETDKIARIKGKMFSDVYKTYIDKRLKKEADAKLPPEQLDLPVTS